MSNCVEQSVERGVCWMYPVLTRNLQSFLFMHYGEEVANHRNYSDVDLMMFYRNSQGGNCRGFGI